MTKLIEYEIKHKLKIKSIELRRQQNKNKSLLFCQKENRKDYKYHIIYFFASLSSFLFSIFLLNYLSTILNLNEAYFFLILILPSFLVLYIIYLVDSLCQRLSIDFSGKNEVLFSIALLSFTPFSAVSFFVPFIHLLIHLKYLFLVKRNRFLTVRKCGFISDTIYVNKIEKIKKERFHNLVAISKHNESIFYLKENKDKNPDIKETYDSVLVILKNDDLIIKNTLRFNNENNNETLVEIINN